MRAIFGTELDRLEADGRAPDAEMETRMESVRRDYERQLDARYAAARGFVDALLAPEETRDALELALRVTLNFDGPHLGQFVLPASPV